MIYKTFKPCNGIVVSVASIVTKQHNIRGGKYLLKTLGNAISETLNLKMSLDASAPKNWCLWCEFQAAYYSLSAHYSKTFWQPWLVISLLQYPCLLSSAYTVSNLSSRMLIYQEFPGLTIQFHDFPALANELLWCLCLNAVCIASAHKHKYLELT